MKGGAAFIACGCIKRGHKVLARKIYNTPKCEIKQSCERVNFEETPFDFEAPKWWRGYTTS